MDTAGSDADSPAVEPVETVGADAARAGLADGPIRASAEASPVAQLSAVFGRSLTDEERARALTSQNPQVSRRFLGWSLGALALLAIGGVGLDHLLGNGAASSPTALAENTGGQNGVPTGIPSTTFVPPNPSPLPGGAITAPLDAYLGRVTLNKRAPAIDLTSEAGAPWTLASQAGHILVITFANAECNDACTVLTNEIAVASGALGGSASAVRFVVVNSDPLETAPHPTPPLITNTALRGLPNVVYLTGSLTRLADVWAAYGVTVVVQNTTRTVTHNEIMYVVDGTGRLRDRLTPFANEGVGGTYTLPSAEIDRFGRGIAAVVNSVKGGS